MKFKILSLFLIAALAIGCNKEKLEPVPQTFLSDAVAFSDSARCVQQVFGLYSAIKNGNMYGGRYMVYQDVRGEEFINRTNNAVTAWLTWQHNLTASANEVQNLWSAGYAAINRCNVVIAGIDGSTINAALKKGLIAEAKVVRALAYNALIQLYARPYADGNGSKLGIILKLNPETSSGDQNQARATVGEIYNQMIKDLNEAEPDLPLTYGNAAANTNRAHRNTAIALKSRLYLNMGQFTNVITEGNKLVPNAAPWVAPSGVANAMIPVVAQVYTNYTSIENILSMPFTALDPPGTQNGLGWYYNPGPNGGGEYALNLAGTGVAVDTLKWRNRDARRSFLVASGGQTWLAKWPNPNNAADAAQVIRYPEVMLNLAEALARNAAGTSVDARALAILNAVRKRSDPTIADFAPATKTDLVDLILYERRIEFLGEGLRTSDVTRTLSPFAAKGTISSVAPTIDQYIWPISIAELLVNKACVQNPGF